MSPVYSSGIQPDPASARDVLAFVLCPLEVFASCGSQAEKDAIAAVMVPVKEQAVRRWQAARHEREIN